MDDALIVNYNDQLYIVDPPPHPGQPVLFVNDGGQMNGVFVKGKRGDNAENVIYELDNSLSKKASDNEGDEVTNLLSKKASDNEGDEVTDSLSKEPDSFSDEHYIPGKGFLSADEDKILPTKSRVIKKDGCKTDSELERFEVIKYKMEEATKPDDAVVKSDMNRDVMKRDVVTEEKLDKNMPSAVNDNSEHGAVTQPDGVTKYRTETKSHSFDSKGYYCNVCHFSFWTEGGL